MCHIKDHRLSDIELTEWSSFKTIVSDMWENRKVRKRKLQKTSWKLLQHFSVDDVYLWENIS